MAHLQALKDLYALQIFHTWLGSQASEVGALYDYIEIAIYLEVYLKTHTDTVYQKKIFGENK